MAFPKLTQIHLGFELESAIPFPATITVTLKADMGRHLGFVGQTEHNLVNNNLPYAFIH